MKCIGFGPYEGKCENEAGTPQTPYWCQRCDDLRVQHISKRFDQLIDESAAYGIDCPNGRCEY